MDKTDLLKRADDLLKFIVDGLEKGEAMASEQAPLIVAEVIRWGIVEHVAYAVLFAGLCIFAITVFLRIKRAYDASKNKWDEDGKQFMMAASGLATTITGVVAFINLVTMLKALVAPRLYLLGVLKDLLH